MDIGKFDPDKIITLQADHHSDLKKRKVTMKRHNIRRHDIKLIETTFPTSKKILCMGCRDDSEVKDFIDAGYDAIGIDIANKSKLIRNIDAHDMINHFASFDVIYTSHILEHLTNPRKVMKDIRAIALNGVVIILPIAKAKKYTIPRWKHPTIFEIMKQKYKNPEYLDYLWKDFVDFLPYNIVSIKYRKGIGEREICICLEFIK